MSRRASLLILAIVGLGSAPRLGAQSCNTAGCRVNTTVSVTVLTVQRLTLSTRTTALGVPTIDNLDSAANPVATTGPTVTGSANVPFTVRVRAATTNFRAPAGVTKSASDLSWALSANGTYTPLTTSGTSIMQHTGTGASTSVTMFYHTAWKSTNGPGRYSIRIMYTLTEP